MKGEHAVDVGVVLHVCDPVFEVGCFLPSICESPAQWGLAEGGRPFTMTPSFIAFPL